MPMSISAKVRLRRLLIPKRDRCPVCDGTGIRLCAADMSQYLPVWHNYDGGDIRTKKKCKACNGKGRKLNQ